MLAHIKARTTGNTSVPVYGNSVFSVNLLCHAGTDTAAHADAFITANAVVVGKY
jgi:hypothetical protein